MIEANAMMPQQTCCGVMDTRVQVPTMRDRLVQKRTVLTAALEDVNAAIAALDAHPDVEAVMDLVQKATY